ncbi:nuclear transport factor 2 family protein [Pseudomonas serbica]
MSTSAIQISNLLYRYAEYLDSGQLVEAAELFRHARIKLQSQDAFLDHSALLGVWQQRIKRYPCGTPRTRHIISNPIIDLDEVAGTANALLLHRAASHRHPSPATHRQRALPR